MYIADIGALDASSLLRTVFFKWQVDADECPELTEREDVSSMPTLKIFKNGKCVHNLAGANQASVDECLKKLV